MNNTPNYTKKDFSSDQEVKWCPGCGDYTILAAIQNALTKIGRKKENIVFVSGIGCSSRFPYYMNTYGYHTIHGRAPAIASGIKVANPELSVWVITGDGDALSIGGNHLIHTIRRNVNLNIILFNNEIYGLTKGQYSPTTKQGHITKSTPYGSLDRPISPAKIAFGSNATFIARTLDTDSQHIQEIMLEAEKHVGTSFVEVYQNCVIFNDGCHKDYTSKEGRKAHSIDLKHGEPIVYGVDNEKGLVFEDFTLKVVTFDEQYKKSDCIVHDKNNKSLASLLVDVDTDPNMPKLYGIIYEIDDVTYDDQIVQQLSQVTLDKGYNSVEKLLYSGDTWDIE